MAIMVRNWENENRQVIAQLGMFRVIEHQKDLSVGLGSAQRAFFAS